MPFQPLAARSLQGFQAPGTNGAWGVVPGTLVTGAVATDARHARITLAGGAEQIAPIDLRLLNSPAGPEPTARQIAVDLPDEDVIAVEVWLDGERLVVPPEILAR
jgi:hypothetical protein